MNRRGECTHQSVLGGSLILLQPPVPGFSKVSQRTLETPLGFKTS
jgi:hypothetical protein